jgi:hypothetical protein
MPATMPSVTSHPESDQNRTWTINRHQLRTVFALCDPEGTGFVSLEHLLQLGRAHCGGSDTKVCVFVVEVSLAPPVYSVASRLRVQCFSLLYTNKKFWEELVMPYEEKFYNHIYVPSNF